MSGNKCFYCESVVTTYSEVDHYVAVAVDPSKERVVRGCSERIQPPKGRHPSPSLRAVLEYAEGDGYPGPPLIGGVDVARAIDPKLVGAADAQQERKGEA
jgi:hypothetical protein